jgi:hypothetical protein
MITGVSDRPRDRGSDIPLVSAVTLADLSAGPLVTDDVAERSDKSRHRFADQVASRPPERSMH